MAESLQRGMRVIVSGRLRQRSYETKEGEKRTVYEVEVDEVGPSLRNASAKVTRSSRSGGGGGGRRRRLRRPGRPAAAAGPAAAAAAAAAAADDPWAQRRSAGGITDEPPF